MVALKDMAGDAVTAAVTLLVTPKGVSGQLDLVTLVGSTGLLRVTFLSHQEWPEEPGHQAMGFGKEERASRA